MATAVRPQLDTSLFFQHLASAEKRALILDFDTTLARAAAAVSRFPYPNALGLLECIIASGRSRVVVVTSRAARKLAGIAGLAEAEIWGSDGLERIPPQLPGSTGRRAPLCVKAPVEAGMRRTLIDALASRGPVAYLVGRPEPAGRSASRCEVLPELHIHGAGRVAAAPEPLVQFLADWLRACCGEVC